MLFGLILSTIIFVNYNTQSVEKTSAIEITVKDAGGRVIGFISSDNKVYDKNRRYLGKSDFSGTYDARNRRVIMNNLPAFLLGKEVGKNL